MNPGALSMGVFFLVMGAVFLAESLGVWALGPGQVWPLLLIGLGAAVLASGVAGGSD